MPPAARDLPEWLRQLELHPEWRGELRRHILTEDLLGVPSHLDRLEAAVERLAEAQARAEERLTRLEAAVERLAEAQARAEERLTRLEEAQLRTEERLTRLEEAQARVEERLTRLEAAVERLAEAQARAEERLTRLEEAQLRTEERLTRLEAAVERLAQAQLNTQRELGALTHTLGATIEVDAEEELEAALTRRGWRLLARPTPLQVNGELDLVARAEDPSGARVWVLVEAKVRVRRHEVGAWAQTLERPTTRAQLRAAALEGPYLAYVFGVRVYPEAETLAAELGIGVLTERGETVAPRQQLL